MVLPATDCATGRTAGVSENTEKGAVPLRMVSVAGTPLNTLIAAGWTTSGGGAGGPGWSGRFGAPLPPQGGRARRPRRVGVVRRAAAPPAGREAQQARQSQQREHRAEPGSQTV